MRTDVNQYIFKVTIATSSEQTQIFVFTPISFADRSIWNDLQNLSQTLKNLQTYFESLLWVTVNNEFVNIKINIIAHKIDPKLTQNSSYVNFYSKNSTAPVSPIYA